MPTPTLQIDQVDVLIVGAGPAGLSTALSLHHHLVERLGSGSETLLPGSPKPKILLVDALSRIQNESRASVIHARTLECLQSISCAQSLLPHGSVSERTFFTSAPKPESTGSALFDVEFKHLEGKTMFPYALLIPQHITEGILGRLVEERLDSGVNLSFVRGIRMVGMKDEDRQINGKRHKGLLVNFGNGQSVWTRYLVGADGGKSTVRTSAQISFSDPTHQSSPFSRILPKPSSQSSKRGPAPEPPLACIADLLFTPESSDRLLKKHPGMQHGIFMTFGADGFFLIAPLKLDPEEWEQYGFDKNGKGERFLYRISFMVLSEEIELAKRALGSTWSSEGTSTASPSDGAGQPGREDFMSNPEAIALVQRKINRGVRYTPSDPGSLTPSEIRRRNETYGIPNDEADPELEDEPINPAMGNVPKVEKVVWASLFKIRQAVAESFYKPLTGAGEQAGPNSTAHILLVGDAAHVHSPAGGQGMNLGIRDGIECGKAIADHIELTSSTSGSKPNPLEAYAAARHREALEIIGVTNKMSKMMVMEADSLSASARDCIFGIVGKWGFAKKKMVWRLSGLGTRRDGSE